MLKVVGFSGAMHAGKSTAANLMEKRGFTRTSFAGPLKRMCLAAGLTEQQVYGTLEDKNREFSFPPSAFRMARMMAQIPPDLFAEMRINRREARAKLMVIYPEAGENQAYITTARKVMQLLGTEWGREVNTELWTTMWKREVDEILARGGRVVVDDARFANEVEALHSYHKRNLIEIQGPATANRGGITGHASENIQPGDVVIYNAKQSTAELWERLEETLDQLG